MTITTRALALATMIVLPGIAHDAAGQQEPPQCRQLRYRSNFRLNSAQQHMDAAGLRTASPTDRQRRLRDAFTNLGEAARTGGIHELTLWYQYARAYTMSGDWEGADSAWARAEGAAAEANDTDCVREITRLRRNEWVPLQRAAMDLLGDRQYDSALVLLHRANVIFRHDPVGYVNIATAYVSLERYDSAAKYFRIAGRVGGEASQEEVRATAALNAARIYQSQRAYAVAESVFREYLTLRPRDMAARTGLAAALSSQGDTQAAAAIYDSILANADSLESFDLFETGIALFRQANADTADAVARARRFAQAARAFELGLAKNPHYRDGLYNLANTYLLANDTANAAAAARRLMAADPLHRRPIELLAETYRRRAEPLRARFNAIAGRRDSAAVAAELRRRVTALQDSTVQLIQRRDSLPLEVSVLRFDARDSTAALRGGVQNLQSREHGAFVLIIEFLRSGGDVVVTERVDVPALGPAGNPGSAYDFNLTANGQGIIAYRYRVGS